jgi:hypothetical protein
MKSSAKNTARQRSQSDGDAPFPRFSLTVMPTFFQVKTVPKRAAVTVFSDFSNKHAAAATDHFSIHRTLESMCSRVNKMCETMFCGSLTTCVSCSESKLISS